MYYIATNEASCAMSPIDFKEPPQVIPRPRCLIGFATVKQAQEAQRICLTAPIGEVARMMRQWRDDPAVKYIYNENPEPATEGPTMWYSAHPSDEESMRDVLANLLTTSRAKT